MISCDKKIFLCLIGTMCFAEKVGRISQSEQRRVSQAAHFRDGII
jgi:hypothetical protein